MTTLVFDGNERKSVLGLPRLTSRVFVDLAIWMASFGVLIGILFPFAIIALGGTEKFALRPKVFTVTILAGIIVGLVNFLLTRGVVGNKLRKLSASMRYVADALELATSNGDRSLCSPETCKLNEDSADEIGDAARSFNLLLRTLAASHFVEYANSTVTSALAEHLVFDELVRAVLQNYINFSNANAGTLLIVRDGKLDETVSQSLIFDVALIRKTAERALETREVKSMLIPDDVFIDSMITNFRPKEVIAVPIWLGGTPLGLVILACGQTVPSETLSLLAGFQSSTAVALNNALTHERFQLLAAIDPLTDAYNRRFGMARLNEEVSRSVRTATPLGLIAFDIDHFKAVNDTYGHLAGDQVLCALTKIARGMLREGDVLIRTGGEEFLIVLPGAGEADVHRISERIRRSVELTVVNVGDAEVKTTVSLGGLSCFGFEGKSIEGLLNEVDMCMYTSKKSGRNKVTISRSLGLQHSAVAE